MVSTDGVWWGRTLAHLDQLTDLGLNKQQKNIAIELVGIELAPRKLGLMHVCKVLFQISLCSLHRLTSFVTFHVCGIFCFKVFSRQKSSLSGKSNISLSRLHWLIWDDTLRTCIKPHFPRARLKYTMYMSSKCETELSTSIQVYL